MRQTLFSILLIALILAAGLVWFRSRRSASVPAERAPGALGEQIAQYRHLKNLKPETGIFSDPLFRALQPAGPRPSRPLGSGGQALPIGRSNPLTPFE